jgi:hypothetical protein
MKKLLVILSATFTILTANAHPLKQVNIPNLVKTGLNKEFNTPSDVKWERKEGLYIAFFTANDFKTCAAYNEQGKLVSLGRYIRFSQLPMNVANELKAQYSNYSLDEYVIEVLRDYQTSYFVTARNKAFTCQLKCSTEGDISVEKRMKNKAGVPVVNSSLLDKNMPDLQINQP